jgi:hypothetical protein
MLTEADVMKFRWGLRNARDQVATQQAQQFQQQQQAVSTTQQVTQWLASRQQERSTELGFGAEGLRQLQAQPAYQHAFQSFQQLAQQHTANPTNAGLEQAATAARMAVHAIEQQFAEGWKARPAVKQSSANLNKQQQRGPQSTSARGGGASGGSYAEQLTALQGQALKDYPDDPRARQVFYLAEKQKIVAAHAKR